MSATEVYQSGCQAIDEDEREVDIAIVDAARRSNDGASSIIITNSTHLRRVAFRYEGPQRTNLFQ